jgi:carbon-monoxide dehydrogenase medium subunit
MLIILNHLWRQICCQINLTKGAPTPVLRDFKRPKSVAEAMAMVREEPGNGGYIAGGTSLGMARMVPYDYLVDISGLGLNQIDRDGDMIRIGATATIHQLATSAIVAMPELEFLGRAARSVATRQIRNMATVGGDLVSGYPVADLPAAFLVLDAQLSLGGDERGQISLEDFFTGGGFGGLDGALVTEIVFPVPPTASRGAFLKYARTENDVAIIDLACSVRMQQGKFARARVALGSTVARPTRLSAVEEFLRGKPGDEETVARAAQLAAEGLTVLDNIRGSQAYRTEMMSVLLRRMLLACTLKGGDDG